MSEIQISSKVQDAERDVICLARFLFWCQTIKKEIGMANKASYGSSSWTKASNPWKNMSISKTEKWRKEKQTCISTQMIHLQKWWWISSVHPMTSVSFLERRSTVSIVFTLGVSENVTPSRPRLSAVGTRLKLCSDIGEKFFSLQNTKSLVFTESTNKRDSGRKSERKERRRNCFLKQDLHETARGLPSTLCGEAHRAMSVEGGRTLQTICPETELGHQGGKFFNKERNENINVKVSSTIDHEMLF